MGIGGGSYAGTLKSSSDPLADGGGVDARGVAIPVELSFGWTPAPGLVLGLGSYGATIPSPSSRFKNFGTTLESDSGSILLSSIGPFVDYYFNPEAGFHGQAGVAFATVAAGKGTNGSTPIPDDDYAGTGWALMVGAGWETWIGEQWSLGALGRLQYAGASLEASNGGNEADVNALFLAILATVTYH